MGDISDMMYSQMQDRMYDLGESSIRVKNMNLIKEVTEDYIERQRQAEEEDWQAYENGMNWETKEQLITNINKLKNMSANMVVKATPMDKRGEWQNYTVEFGDGHIAEYGLKDGNTLPFTEGQEWEHERYTDNYDRKKVKSKKKAFNGGGKSDPKKDAKITRMNAFNRAVELTLSQAPFDGDMNELKALTVEIERFFNEA